MNMFDNSATEHNSRKRHIMKFTNLFVLSLLAALIGCSTIQTPIPRTTGPSIIVVRDTGFNGAGCTFDVLVDGEVIGQVQAGQTVIKLDSNGKHRDAIDNSTAMCPNVKMSHVVDVTGEPVVLRIGFTSNFQTIFDQVELPPLLIRSNAKLGAYRDSFYIR